MVEGDDARREYPVVARDHEHRLRLDHQVADGQDQRATVSIAIGTDDDAGTLTLGA